jgi:hypothetical protein
MRRIIWLTLAVVGIVAVENPAQAWCGPHWSIGIGIGVPVYRPYYPYYYPYPYGYPYYYYPPPAPVVVQQPVIQQVPVQGAPVQQQQAPQQYPQQVPPPAPSQVQTRSAPVANSEYYIHQLASPDEHVRAESALQLGRTKDPRAVDPLAATLSGDRSPAVRESAARALGLLGSQNALPALQHAVQTDTDHDVRRSAQFAVDVIQNH